MMPNVIATVGALLAVSGIAVTPASSDREVVFDDAVLKSCVATHLGVAETQPITEHQLESISQLICGEGISNLTPLAHAPNISYLKFGKGRVSDLSPLSDMDLVHLTVDDNAVEDVSPLAGMTHLSTLSLSGNAVTDVSPLAGLRQVTWLFLNDNAVTDVKPLAGLPLVDYLALDDNAVTDLSPLAGLTSLQDLTANDNSISDVSPLAGLTKLQTLRLDRNAVSDLSPLSSLANITRVSLKDNALTGATAHVGVPVANPVRNVAGNPIRLSAPASCVDAACVEVNYPIPGTGVATSWTSHVTVGKVTTPFTGILTRDVIERALTVAPDGLTGTGTRGASITITREFGTVSCGPVIVAPDGTWACTPETPYEPGEYRVAQEIDAVAAGTTAFTITGSVVDDGDTAVVDGDIAVDEEKNSDVASGDERSSGSPSNFDGQLARTGSILPIGPTIVGVLVAFVGILLSHKRRKRAAE